MHSPKVKINILYASETRYFERATNSSDGEGHKTWKETDFQTGVILYGLMPRQVQIH